MATPNEMPKKPNKLREQVMSALIETKPTGWKMKVWNEESKQVDTVDVEHQGLRFPLAGNMSEEAVERLSRRWL